MNAPHLPRDHTISPLGVIVTAMALVAACFGMLAIIGRVIGWWRGGI